VRDRYGPARRFGQSCLAFARRLIERGVRFVTVQHVRDGGSTKITWGHPRQQSRFTDIAEMGEAGGAELRQRLQQACLQDLKDRGMLESTVVIAVGEFGRTPKVNPAGGRGSSPGRVDDRAWGGGPIKGGPGSSANRTKLGLHPENRRPVTPPEVGRDALSRAGPGPAQGGLPGPARNRPDAAGGLQRCSRSRSCSNRGAIGRDRKVRGRLEFLGPPQGDRHVSLRGGARSTRPLRPPS